MYSAEAGGHLPQRKICDILLEEGRISREQLDEALRLQRNDLREVGDILLSLGYIDEAAEHWRRRVAKPAANAGARPRLVTSSFVLDEAATFLNSRGLHR